MSPSYRRLFVLLLPLRLLFFPSSFGGDERVRTDGLLLARQALSQLSYTPMGFSPFGTLPSLARFFKVRPRTFKTV